MLKSQIDRLWESSPWLTGTAVAMLAVFVASLVGLATDPRIVTDAPVWMKPVKFAISSAIYSGTIAWLIGYLEEKKQLAQRLGDVIACMLIIEVALIDLQAARGRISHFNMATPLDIAIFSVMGIAIGILLIASAWFCWLLFRQNFGDKTWGWALKLGMLITVLGSSTGGLMVKPTPEQLEHHLAGGHTVGALDGGPGMPGVGWSTEHGDLRIPHFLGLHAIQVIPFLAWLVRRRRRATALVFTAAGSYFTLMTILTWQALRAESVALPGAETLAALSLWFTLSSTGAIAYLCTPQPGAQQCLPRGRRLEH